jgi:hypothetical protein
MALQGYSAKLSARLSPFSPHTREKCKKTGPARACLHLVQTLNLPDVTHCNMFYAFGYVRYFFFGKLSKVHC